MKLSEISHKTIRASSYLFIGPQGCGKTIAAASYPDCKLYDNEGKTESLINWYKQPKYKKYLDTIDVEAVTDFFYFTYNTLADIANSKTRPPFKTLIVDSVTNGSQMIVNSMLSARRKIPAIGSKSAGGDRAKIAPGGVMLPSWDEFDAEDTVLGAMLDYLVTIQMKFNVNVICTAHPHSVGGPSGISEVSRIVAKGHKAPQTVLNKFNEIYHFEKISGLNVGDEVIRRVHTVSGTFSRTAWPFLPATIDFHEPNPPFYETLKGYLDANLGTDNEGGSTNDLKQQLVSNQPQELD